MRFNPPLPAIAGNVVKLTVRGLAFNQLVQSSFYYMNSGFAVSIAADLAAFGPAWEAAVLNAYLNCFAADFQSDGAFVADASAQLAPTYNYNWIAGPTPGGQVGASIPTTSSAILSWSTTVRGQHGRGRTYMGPVPALFTTPATSPDTVNAAGITAFNALIVALVTTPIVVNGLNYLMAIATRPTQPATAISLARPVSGGVLRNPLGTTRRRREGRGQ